MSDVKMYARGSFPFTPWHFYSLICWLSTSPEWTNSRDLWEFDAPLLPKCQQANEKRYLKLLSSIFNQALGYICCLIR